MGGVPGSTPAPALLVCIVAMAVLELFGMVVRSSPRAWYATVTTVVAVLLPVLAVLLLALWSDPVSQASSPSLRLVPTLVIAILGMTAVILVACLSSDDPPDSQGFFLASGIAVAVSVLALDIAAALFEDASSRLLMVSLVMVVAGVVAAHDRLTKKPLRRLDGERVEGDQSPEAYRDVPHRSPSGVASLMTPLVLITVFCTFELGQAWQEGLFAELASHRVLLLAVVASGLAVTGIVYVSWKRTRSIDSFLVGLVCPLVLPIIVAIFENVLPNTWIAGILMLSQIMYLLFSWTAIVLVGRLFSASDTVMPVFVIVLLALYALFMAGPHIDNIVLVSRLVNSVSLGLLVCLTVFFFSKANQPSATDTGEVVGLGMDQALRRRCDELAHLHGLSPRESELLPMLAVGLSAGVIGKRVFVSEHTVKTHRYRIYQKLGVTSHEELVEKLGIVQVPGK